MGRINWLAVIVAAVAGMVLGYLWYGVLFMDPWAEAHGIVANGDTFLKDGKELEGSNLTMAFNSLGMIVYALILAWLINKTNMWGFVKGAIIGGVVGLVSCIDLTLNNMFAFNPSMASVIDGSYIVIILAVMGGIIGVWKKK